MKHSIILRKLLCVIVSMCALFWSSIYAYAKYYPENRDNIYVHMQTDQKTVALTFDDGPHPQKTQKILDVLKKYGVRATFFVIGENAKKYPEQLQMIVADGHEIGNHTYDHKSLYKQSEDTLCQSVEKCKQTIKEITGIETVYFRPPEGYMNDAIAMSMNHKGYNVILWRVDTYDWKGLSGDQIAKNVLNTVKNGDIILMHDYIWRKSYTEKALDIIIPELQKQGYSFVTASEVISS